MGSDDGNGRVPIPRMEARGMFFDGQVEAEVLHARAGVQWARKDESKSSPGPDQQSAGGHVSGGFGGGRGGGHHGGGRGGNRGGGQGGGTAEGGPQTPPIHASTRPGIELRLRLTNHRALPIAVEVIDFNSDLGDYVVQPAKIMVPPGASIEADPMVSRLGASADEIPLTVKLQIEGRSDQQVLILKKVKEEPPDAPPPAECAPVPAPTNPPTR